MAIPESQLETWSTQGATSAASATYQQVQRALSAPGSRVRTRAHEVYLQGSYRNDTNTRGDSDVDVIAELTETYYHDIAPLDPLQRQRYETSRTPASYSWREFRQDVLDALRASFGHAAVRERNKCISIAPAAGRLPADIVAAATLKRYSRFLSRLDESHHAGITFWTQRENRQIVNWPKQHYQHGVEKNRLAAGRYKAAVRMFKNARAKAVDRGFLTQADAPSFFVECLIFNVPERCFEATKGGTYVAAVNWLQSQHDKSGFRCGNLIVPLFGPSSEQWDVGAANRTIDAWIRLWNHWA